MHMDPAIHSFTGIVLIILFIGIIFKFLKIPSVMAYLSAGIVIGPHGMAIIPNQQAIIQLESVGILLLLFFVGMKVSLHELVSNWKIAIVGTFFQILASVLCVGILGMIFDWPWERIILLGFVISISSTAIVLKILGDRKEIASEVGRNVIGILLIQDLAIIPMIIVLEFLGGKAPSTQEIALQAIGGSAIILLLIWLNNKKHHIKLPFTRFIENNHDMQVFTALVLCFGIAFLTEFFSLSGALGAFIAGIVVSMTKEIDWVKRSLRPFYVLFVTLFFVSIGMLIDVTFLKQYWIPIMLLVVATYLTNTFINAIVMRVLGVSWQKSLHGGSLLAQIGEFSFILIAIGWKTKTIGIFEYQMVIYTIALTLFFGPVWASLIKMAVNQSGRPKHIIRKIRGRRHNKHQQHH